MKLLIHCGMLLVFLFQQVAPPAAAFAIHPSIRPSVMLL